MGLHFAGAHAFGPEVTTYGIACKISNIFSEMSTNTWNGRIKINKSSISGGGNYCKVNGKCYELSGFAGTMETTHKPDSGTSFSAFLTESECVND